LDNDDSDEDMKQNAPGFMDDDSDEEDVGKKNVTGNDLILNADSDDGNDVDFINNMSTELADFGTDDSNKAASNIPKLSGPK
jgi:hypothetical protein